MNTKADFISTREAARLLGVGLTTVQQWVESGALPAWKTAGGHRRIPLVAVDVIRLQQQAALGTNLRSTPEPRLKVLLVEDDPMQREIYGHQFADWKLPVQLFTAEDGFQGLIMIGRHSPDLIITDLAMPGMDGFEMIRRIKSRSSVFDGSIIVVTALGAEQIKAFGGLPEGIQVFSKPLSFELLRQLVEGMTSTAASQDRIPARP
ncbi:MAG: response regulator [Rhodocyclales bacterium]|nr:response regulator [Rhodocyclales bacterium]